MTAEIRRTLEAQSADLAALKVAAQQAVETAQQQAYTIDEMSDAVKAVEEKPMLEVDFGPEVVWRPRKAGMCQSYET